MPTYGNIEQYDVKEDIESYLEHVDQFFCANELTSTTETDRVGKMPTFMSKVHAGGIYWYLPAFTDIAGFCYYSLY